MKATEAMSPLAAIATAAPHWFDWFSSPWGIATTSMVTLIGLPLALYGIVRTARAATSKRSGIVQASRVLRTSGLRDAINETKDLESRIIMLRDNDPDSATEFPALAASWLGAQRRIFGLLRYQGQTATIEDFQKAMQSASAEIQVARTACGNSRKWKSYKFPVLRRKLHDYGQAAEALLQAADDEVLNA